MAEQHIYTNRLIHQKSPYLLQHSHNPVDWYPWGEEAFRAAQDQDKPIFLSIGYATCHWCHVMERESFEDPSMAQLLNEAFINIKVDREELPEVDSLYMEFAQGMMSGAAGWPLNVILTPDLKPFFAATYLPPQNKHGMIGLTELIHRINEVWHGEEREAVVIQAAQVVEVFAESVYTKGEELPEKEAIEDAADMLFKMADPVYGGMRGTPKFPIGYQYNFMLHYAVRHNESRAYFLVERTLEMMHRGGIYDHLGGGFSRYSVDEHWLVPHFEKMLYDNALLSFAYLEAWQATKNPLYREVCEEVLDYVLREMTHPDGGFYSAQDAESEGREGLYYLWTPHEIRDVLGEDDGDLFCDFFGVTEEGNFEGRNVLHMPHSVAEFAAHRKMDPQELNSRLIELRRQLWKVRNKRVPPFKDDKILTPWNGLMIFSLIEAGRAFSERRYVDAAVKGASFIHSNLWKNGQLYRRWREGEASFEAGLDEYACLIRAIISLYSADCGSEWLAWAMEMAQMVKEKFKEEGGAFYQTDGKDPNIILRKCQFADGAEPSGNAIHCENLMRLYQITWDTDYLNQARDILKAVNKFLESYAPGYCYHLINLNRYYDQRVASVVVALNAKEESHDVLLKMLYSEFLPHKVISWRRLDDPELSQLIPSIKEQGPIDGKTTVYICREGACQRPLTDLNEITEAFHKLS